ncbi:MAG: AAA family ATPase [Butyrivibrio sp.]|nr:AAA family ATPase [Butyrivibrio sp.]
MYIKSITEINNYRNLSGKTIGFDRDVNFLIGENNIGKTNVLELINIIFNVGKFKETDFNNVLDEIKIRIEICYEDAEIGFFEDNFDVDSSNTISIIAIQEIADGKIEYYHDTPNFNQISASVIKKLNVLYYYAQRMPSKEVDFRKTNGSGKVLNYLIQHSLENAGIEEKDVVKKTKINQIIKDINKQIYSINNITGDNVSAYVDSDINSIICRMLELGDENGRDLSSLGEGIQYAFNIILQIIEIIHSNKIIRKPEDFEDRLVVIDGKKLFPIFLILDEPEIHQHPYRQRNLMKKINALLKNDNEDFILLLRELFGVDGLIGQIFIATHSPNILLNNYRQFIRIFHDESGTGINIVSGSNIMLNDTLYKHLLRSFVYLREAMFSKCVLFVEGDTENGAMPIFGNRMGLDYDENGIGIIKLDGADSVENCMKLYDEFKIKTIAILDKDKKATYKHLSNVYFTKGMDFEEDIYDNFCLIDYLRYNVGVNKIGAFIGVLRPYGIRLDVPSFINDPVTLVIDENLQNQIKQDIKENELSVLRATKNASKGALLAEYVTEIPKAFQRVIKKLKAEVN